jgi:hypothetical protein
MKEDLRLGEILAFFSEEGRLVSGFGRFGEQDIGWRSEGVLAFFVDGKRAQRQASAVQCAGKWLQATGVRR